MKANLDDLNIHVKLKLSALWVSVLFCYVYGDFFSLFTPGRIQNLMDGRSGAGTTTPTMLLLYAILMSIPALMIFLSLAMRPAVSRWANVVTGVFFTLVMILVVITSIDHWMIFYTYLGVIEIVLTILIVWYALKWPREEQHTHFV
jgi:hypothetical protein